MKKKVIYWVLGIIIILAGVLFFGYNYIASNMSCTLDAKICEDGSSVGRNKFCNMKSCPKIITCDSNSDCPEYYICLEQEDRDKPACHYTQGFMTPCKYECGLLNCTLSETDPVRAVCSES